MTLEHYQKKKMLLSLIDRVKHNIVKPKRAREFQEGEQFVVCELMHITAKGNEEFEMEGQEFYRHPFSTFPGLNTVPAGTDIPMGLEELFVKLEEATYLIQSLREELVEAKNEIDRLKTTINYRNRTEKEIARGKAEITAFLSGKFI